MSLPLEAFRLTRTQCSPVPYGLMQHVRSGASTPLSRTHLRSGISKKGLPMPMTNPPQVDIPAFII